MGIIYSKIRERIMKISTLFERNCKNHKYDKNDDVELKYKLPYKSDSLSEFQSPHHTLRYLWQSNYSAPVEDILLSSGVVLDAGCGFGAWLIDMALEYPTTDFVGVGLSPHQFPSQIPNNIKFAQANILSGLPFEDNEFDFVRLCYFANSLACTEWEPLIKELIRVTKPGGWIEFIEPGLVPTNMGPKFTILIDTLNQIIGERSNIAERLEVILQSTNQLKNIQKDTKSLTIGRLGGEVGISHENSILRYFIDESSVFYNRLGISSKDYEILLEDVRKEFQTRKVKEQFFRFWGQKIEP
ncbi:S-adenosyl-L-methionine-dependent methyltransferase [Rhizophagus clarus]|nr:S-adenosyl-L-methionine-dependent methyltransferase [Rhizophagus clarus]